MNEIRASLRVPGKIPDRRCGPSSERHVPRRQKILIEVVPFRAGPGPVPARHVTQTAPASASPHAAFLARPSLMLHDETPWSLQMTHASKRHARTPLLPPLTHAPCFDTI